MPGGTQHPGVGRRVTNIQGIKLRLGLDPDHFWRAANGKEFPELPTRARQPTLFDNDP
jgi:hypothetical protein